MFHLPFMLLVLPCLFEFPPHKLKIVIVTLTFHLKASCPPVLAATGIEVER